jgi:hypothetical protein
MSALDISAVTALWTKAAMLYSQGAFVRAAEKYASARTAAEALGQADCLVVASLQLQQADCLFTQEQELSADTPEDEREAMLRKAFALLPAAMATLQRRRAARTLLPGGCRAYEVAFDLVQLAHAGEGDDLSAYAPLFGYNCFLLAAKMVFVRVQYFGWAPAEAHMRAAHVAFVCDALDLVAQPRNFNASTWTGSETGLVQQIQGCPKMQAMRANDEHDARMLAAWVRLQRSGVLEERGVNQGAKFMERTDKATKAAAAAAAAAKGLHGCALASCTAREVNAGQHKKCGACRTVGYCCKAHQVEDWPQHKAACKAARAAAAQRSDT